MASRIDRQPLSLPPASPFTNPFDSPTPLWQQLQDRIGNSLGSPTPISPAQMQTAYVAGRSSADLVRLIDLAPPRLGAGELPASAGSGTFRRRTTLPSRLVISPDIPDRRGESSGTLFQGGSINMPPLSAFNPSPAKASPHPVSASTQRSSSTRRSSQISPASPRRSASLTSPNESSFLRMSRGPAELLLEETAPLDRSFLRMSMSTNAFSDIAPSSTWSFHGNGNAVSRPLETLSKQPDQGEDASPGKVDPARRGSAGTFGNKSRRWSAIGSTTSSGGDRDRSDGRREGDTGEERDGQDPYSASSPSRRPRPLSMSSASTSTGYSGPTVSVDKPGRAYPSPPGQPPLFNQKRPSHKQPETEQAIHAHLLKQSAINERHIVPRDRVLPLGTAITLVPPSTGTPLRAGGVEEESLYGDSSESDFGTKAPPNAPRGRQSKLDQMLGQGAESARILLSSEKTSPEATVEQRSSKGPVPLARGHQASASVPAALPSSPQGTVLLAPGTPGTTSTPLTANGGPGGNEAFPSPVRGRSASVDSLPSLHPSKSESVNSLSRLLPQSPLVARPPQVPPKIQLARNIPAELVAHNDLPPEQRAMLLKRTRKLEQMLGESLNEQQIGQLVVAPSNASQTITTKVAENEWPRTPSPRRARPEWARQDCVPRTVKDPAPGPTSLSGSTLAKKAKAALGLDRQPKTEEGDLKVYVDRELRVSETNVPRQTPKPSINRSPVMQSQHSPESPRGTIDTFANEEEDEVTRRHRRQQLAKLHRLLGAPIPISLLNQPIRDAQSRPVSSSGIRRDTAVPPSSKIRAPTPSNLSFMAFEDDTRTPTSSKWASKLRQTITKKRSLTTPDDASFIDMQDTSPFSLGTEAQPLSEKEKAAARRKAQKLEQVFGNAPPPTMYLAPKRPLTPLSDRDVSNTAQRKGTPSPVPSGVHGKENEVTRPNGRSGSYDAYKKSLEGLLFLADNDRCKLADIMDSLEDTTAPTHPASHPHHLNAAADLSREAPPPRSTQIDSPSSAGSQFPNSTSVNSLASIENYSPDRDPNSHANRVRRTSKLTQFFGETSIDFTDPPAMPVRHGSKRKSKSQGKNRRETLDALLGEMWRGVQIDMKRGGLRGDELERLGEMMGALRRRREWEEL